MISSRPANGTARGSVPNAEPDATSVHVPHRRRPTNGPAREQQQIHRALRMTVQRPVSGVVVVRMIGEVDLLSAPRINELIRQRLTAASLRVLILDLSDVTFIGSCGIELLLHAQRRAEHRDIGLVLVNVSTRVQRLLELTGMTEQFRRHDTVTAALGDLDLA